MVFTAAGKGEVWIVDLWVYYIWVFDLTSGDGTCIFVVGSSLQSGDVFL
jgi:hypothetical protein